MFKLQSDYRPSGDQPEAIEKLSDGILKGRKHQVLLGATGTGKTFTIANVIAKVNKPTLVLAHNKTLAGQLYTEFKELFPDNRVEYFVSNFDFYRPEAYLPSRDLYIDKEAVMNEDIEMLRASAINAVLERRDTIVVASVAAIFALSDPEEYRALIFIFQVGQVIDKKEVLSKLVLSQYQRNDIDLAPGTFRAKGDVIEIAPPDNKDLIIRIELFDDLIEKISQINPVTGRTIKTFKNYAIYPAYSHATTYQRVLNACQNIKDELKERLQYFKDENKLLEHQRLSERTLRDLESLAEFGMCPGIENYSRHIEKREPGEPPFSLVDYFPNDFLLVVDESHVSIPQIRGMYNGDRARKINLVDYGFRLPSALDNRPLRFDEFESKINQVIYVSATPANYEIEKSNRLVIEQIIRPTGLLDPLIEVKSAINQIDDIIEQIKLRVEKNQRVMITTLTIKMAEDLTEYLRKSGLKVVYLHSETKTLDRSNILYEVRKGKYDVLVGINLLREGIDLPEVSLILILDSDKEGFLRSETSLIQIIGRAARNSDGKVIMYANSTTKSMENAINETIRRRQIQEKYNQDNNLIPQTIIKSIKKPVGYLEEVTGKGNKGMSLNAKEKQKLINKIEREMKEASRQLDYEKAIELRDYLIKLQGQ